MVDIIHSPDAYKRQWRLWPVEQPKAIVQIVHGMVEHMGRYDAYAQHLNAQGFFVCGVDHMGHGGSVVRSEDLGIFDEGWQRLVADVDLLARTVRKQHPDVPIFFLGHSMGSFVLRAYAAISGFYATGLILMGTAQLPALLGLTGITLTGIIEKLFGPRHRNRLLNYLSTGRYEKAFKEFASPFAWLSTDPAAQAAYASDPFSGFAPTVAMNDSVLRLLMHVSRPKTIGRIPKTLPTFVLSGSQDPVGNFGVAVLTFYRMLIASGHQEATLKLYPQARHELLNERNKDLVYEDLDRWFALHIRP